MPDSSIFYPSNAYGFKGYTTGATSRTIAPGGIAVRYREAGDPDTPESDALPPSLTLDLMPLMRGAIVPGSLRFRLGTHTYIDRAGVLYHSINVTNGSGTPAGTINYATGVATITSWSSGAPNFVLEAGLVNPGAPGMTYVIGRTLAAPLKSQSFSIAATKTDGTQIAATAAANGSLVGPSIKGFIDTETGVFSIGFGQDVGPDWEPHFVDPSSLRYNTVAFSYLPLDASIIGLDPVRLPPDGNVPIFRRGDFAVLGHTATIGPLTVSNAQVIDCGRVRLSRVRVIGNNGQVINTGYTANLEAGTVTFTNVSGYSQPVRVEHRIEDMAQISDAQINGQLTFTRQITHDYPVGAVVSSALVAGDQRARVATIFDQATWNGTWTDSQSGSAATGTYNDVLAPIQVTNDGASNERWAIVFTNTTSFNVIGEHVGVIATGNTATNLAPINPATGNPYFTLLAVGWGSGWSAGNVLRFNTVGAFFPVWVIRTVQQGPETVTNDSFTLLIRGDVDAP